MWLIPGSNFLSVYKGEFIEDFPHGKGMYLDAKTGYIIGGNFKLGEPDKAGGEFRFRYSNGDIYEGNT